MPYGYCPICYDVVYLPYREKRKADKKSAAGYCRMVAACCGHSGDVIDIYEKGESKMKKKDYVLDERCEGEFYL